MSNPNDFPPTTVDGEENHQNFSSQLPSNVYAPASTFIMVPPSHRFYYSSIYPPNTSPYFQQYHTYPQDPNFSPENYQQYPSFLNPYSPQVHYQSQYHHPAMIPSTTPPPPITTSTISSERVFTAPNEPLPLPPPAPISEEKEENKEKEELSSNEEPLKSDGIMTVSPDDEEKEEQAVEDIPFEPYTSSTHHQSSLKLAHRCTQLTLQQKIEVLEMIERKTPYREIAKLFNIAHSTISGIKKTKEEIYELIQKRANLSMHRIHKSMPITSKILDERMYNWYLHNRQQNIPINGRQIQQKALEIAKDLNLPEFKASNGWLDSFKRRHQILLKQQSEL